MLILYDLDDTLYSRTEQLPDDYGADELQAITPFPGVVDLLRQKRMVHVLVTRGEMALQSKKLAVLGLTSLFDTVFICPRDEDKKQCFQEALQKFPKKDAWVIGNRLDSEIRYGKELGLKTIYLRHGKYRGYVPRDAYEVPEYEVERFEDVVRILRENRR
ncbi:HAD hydrolase-like protein [Candidatus Woesearchaeota archaeon]|nr:HAD hydrolase-like protein [Candidatus Woesearchaeota archaeon]